MVVALARFLNTTMGPVGMLISTGYFKAIIAGSLSVGIIFGITRITGYNKHWVDLEPGGLIGYLAIVVYFDLCNHSGSLVWVLYILSWS